MSFCRVDLVESVKQRRKREYFFCRVDLVESTKKGMKHESLFL